MSDPATLGLVISVAASVASQLLGPKQPGITTTGPRVGDTGVSSSAYGETIPINFGTVRTGGNVIWSPGRREVRLVVESEQGKGGGATTTSTTFAYFLDAAIAIGEGPLTNVTRIWANSKLIYDARPGSDAFFKYPTAKIRVYSGTEDQAPDPLIEAAKGTGNAPAYAGLAYIVVQDLPLRDFGNGMPQFTFEATWAGVPQYPKELLWSGANSASNAGDGDFEGANPRFDQLGSVAFDPENDVLWASTGGASVSFGLLTWSRIDLKAGSIVAQRNFLVSDGPDLLYDLFNQGNKAVVDGPWLVFMASSIAASTRALYRVGKKAFGVAAKSATLATGTAIHELLVFDSLSPLELEPEPALIGISLFPATIFMGPVEFDDGETIPVLSATSVSLFPGSTQFDALVGPDYKGRFWLGWHRSTTDCGLARVNVFSGGVSESAGRFGGGVGARYFSTPVIDSSFDLRAAIFGVAEPPSTMVIRAMHLDQDNQQILLFISVLGAGGLSLVAKWDIETESLVEYATLVDMGEESFNEFGNTFQLMVTLLREQRDVQHVLWRPGTGGVRKIEWNAVDGVNGTGFKITELPIPTDFGVPAGPATEGHMHVVKHNWLLWLAGDDTYKLELDRFSTGPDDLEDVVLSLCARSGIDTSIVDASALSGISVEGVELSSRGASRDLMDRLSIAYLFDFIEGDNGIKFVLRGGSSVETVDGDDLGASLERLEDSPRRLAERTLQEDEVPFQVDVKYIDVDRDYQASAAQAKRLAAPTASVESREPQRLELPVVFDAQAAARMADAQLGITWAGREKQSGQLPPRFLALEPSDVVTVQRDGEENLLVRVDELSFGGGMLVGFESSQEDPDIYTSSVEGSSGTGLLANDLEVPGSVSLRVLDVPLLKDSHARADLTGPYLGVELDSGDFRGAVVHQSLDQLSWAQVTALPEHVLGFLVMTEGAALPEEFAYQTDHDTSLMVIPLNDESAGALETITDAQLLSERNVAVWGSQSGGWEVVKFRDATDNGDGSWALGGAWIRARRGTARIAALGHPVGDFLLLLNPGQSPDSWARNTYEVGTLGQSRFFRATPLGHPFEAVEFSTFNISGTDLKPYEVVHVESQRDVPSTNDVRLTWVRQTRVGGQAEWGDGVTDTPLSEASEQYEVVLLGGPLHASPGSEALSKTFTDQVDTSGDDFTAAEQSAAGYVTSDDLSFVIYQLSEAVGRGFPRSVTVPGV